jgi:hypothetical protein
VKRALSAIFVLLVLVSGSWVGVSYYAGVRAHSDIEQLVNEAPEQSPVRFTNLVHERGILISRGEVILHYPDPSVSVQPQADLFRMRVAYTIDHRAMLATVFRFSWNAQLIDEAGQTMRSVFGLNPRLSGQGQLSWQGQASSSYLVPALQAQERGDSLRMGAITGELRALEKALNFDMAMNGLEINTAGEVLKLQDLRLTLDLTDRFAGVGTSTFGIDRLFFNAGTANGLLMTGEHTIDQGRLNVRSDLQVANLMAYSYKVSDVAIKFAINGLDNRSVTALSNVLNLAGNLDNLNATQQVIVQSAVRDLILQGFSVGFPSIFARSGQATLEGDVALLVKPSLTSFGMTPARFDVAKTLTSEGKLLLKGQGIPVPVTAAGLLLGILQQTTKGFESSYQFKNGLLAVNGQALDVQAYLPIINEAVSELIKPVGR